MYELSNRKGLGFKFGSSDELQTASYRETFTPNYYSYFERVTARSLGVTASFEQHKFMVQVYSVMTPGMQTGVNNHSCQPAHE